jgi:hypothetical protein
MFAASTAYSSATFYKWKAKYGGKERAQTTRVRSYKRRSFGLDVLK